MYVLAYICVCVYIDERKHPLLALHFFFHSWFSPPFCLWTGDREWR